MFAVFLCLVYLHHLLSAAHACSSEASNMVQCFHSGEFLMDACITAGLLPFSDNRKYLVKITCKDEQFSLHKFIIVHVVFESAIKIIE